METPSADVQQQKCADKQQYLLEVIQRHTSDSNRLAYRLDKCIEEYERWTMNRTRNSNNYSNNSGLQQYDKVYLLVQRMGRLRNSGLVLWHEINKCVNDTVKSKMQNEKQKENSSKNDEKEFGVKSNHSSDYDSINVMNAETEHSTTQAKAVIQDVERKLLHWEEMENRRQSVESKTECNAEQQSKDKELTVYNDNKTNNKVDGDKEDEENAKLLELYKCLQSCVHKTTMILSIFTESIFAPLASEQLQTSEHVRSTTVEKDKVTAVQDYCPLSLIGATATELESEYVMCEKLNSFFNKYTDSINNINTSKCTHDSTVKEHKLYEDKTQDMHEKEYELEEECSNQEVQITQKSIKANNKDEEVLQQATIALNIAKDDETVTRPPLEMPPSSSLFSLRIIQVNNTNMLRMATNISKSTCYSEDHIIMEDEETNLNCTNNEKSNIYTNKKNVHYTEDDTNNKTSRSSLVHSKSSLGAQKKQENAKCESTKPYDHTDTHLCTSSTSLANSKANAIKNNESKSKVAMQSNEAFKSINTVGAVQPEHQSQSPEKQVEDAILTDIQHAIHSMKTSAIKVSEIIQHEQTHFAINAELLTKQVHSTEGNIQQINKLSAIRQSHSNPCMLWLEKLPVGKLLVHSFLLPLWSVVKQIVYFTIILICTLLTLFLMTVFHKPHSYRLHPSLNETATNTWSTFDVNMFHSNNVSNEYNSNTSSSNITNNAFGTANMQRADNIIGSNYTTSSCLHSWNLANTIAEEIKALEKNV